MPDQLNAEAALARLEVLIGEWLVEAAGVETNPWRGTAATTFEWARRS